MLCLEDVIKMIPPFPFGVNSKLHKLLMDQRITLFNRRIEQVNKNLSLFRQIWPKGLPVDFFIALKFCDDSKYILLKKLFNPHFLYQVLWESETFGYHKFTTKKEKEEFVKTNHYYISEKELRYPNSRRKPKDDLDDVVNKRHKRKKAPSPKKKKTKFEKKNRIKHKRRRRKMENKDAEKESSDDESDFQFDDFDENSTDKQNVDFKEIPSETHHFDLNLLNSITLVRYGEIYTAYLDG